ncbi:hypothetical protein QX776_12220 [Alteromonadaceae bacterium BrNp21-10]|nr:hypothetical protein [Alteromonadaceae bacterium BrNp21-10]
MNRSAKGFGMLGVVFAVILMAITAVFGAKAEAAADPAVITNTLKPPSIVTQ